MPTSTKGFSSKFKAKRQAIANQSGRAGHQGKAHQLLLIFILLIAAFLRFYLLDSMMIFIGDQAWFYLSARDMLLTGNIPLVGITTSHTWLHQGPLWTYILALIFFLSHFNPLAPAYVTAGIDVLTVFFVYKVGLSIFSQRTALIAALMYATSPLIVLISRMPYHISLIPVFTVLFIFATFKWVKGNVIFFPVALFLLACLYNFELATVVLCGAFAAIFVYGFWKKSVWVQELRNKKIIILSIFAAFIPMIPILIYDASHGFPQTFKFALWIGYKIARIFGFPDMHKTVSPDFSKYFFHDTLREVQRLIFLPNLLISVLLLISGFSITTYQVIKMKSNSSSYVITWLFFTVSLIGYASLMTASDAYLAVFFPLIPLILACAFDFILRAKKLHLLGLALVIIIAALNSYWLIKSKYFLSENTPTFSMKASAAKTIIQKANGRAYNLVWTGPGRHFASFTMNYEYLAWWLGHAPSTGTASTKIYINEDGGTLNIKGK